MIEYQEQLYQCGGNSEKNTRTVKMFGVTPESNEEFTFNVAKPENTFSKINRSFAAIAALRSYSQEPRPRNRNINFRGW